MDKLAEKDPAKNRLVAVALASSGYAIGYYISIMNSMAAPLLDGVFRVAKEDRLAVIGNLNFFFALGAALGVLVGSRLMDAIGRRKINMLLDVLSIAYIGLMAVESLPLFTALRFLMGFNASTYTMVAGIAMVEIYPKRLGAVGNMINYSILTGTILLTFVQQIVFGYEILRDHWRVFICYPIVIPVWRLLVLHFFMRYDSPVYLLAKHRDDPDLKLALKANLAEVYAENNLDAHIDGLVERSKESAHQVTFAEALGPKYRKELLSALIGLIGQQFTGINFLIFFSTELFDKISGSGKSISFVFGAGNFMASFLGILVINRFARTHILKVGVLLQGASLMLLLVCIWLRAYLLLPLFILAYIVTYSVGFGGTVVLYVNEILPPTGVGFCIALCWMTCSLVGKFCPLGVEVFGGNAMIFFFGSCCLALYFLVGRFCVDNTAVPTKAETRFELSEHILAK